MKKRKYGYVIMTALLVLFMLLLFVEKNRDTEPSEEIDREEKYTYELFGEYEKSKHHTESDSDKSDDTYMQYIISDHSEKYQHVFDLASVKTENQLYGFWMGEEFVGLDRDVSGISLLFTDIKGQKPVQDVQIALIRGHDNPNGEKLYRGVTGEDGCARLMVPFGEYTVLWRAEGYYGGCQNITAEGETISLQKNMLPYAGDISAYVLLEWEGEEDLDLCVYDEHSERCIGRVLDVENKDSCLYQDNDGETGYELVYLGSGTIKNYIVYVKDSDSITENRDSSMGQSRATVSIYTKDGLLYQKTADAGTDRLWKCALLREGEVTDQDESIHDLTDYAWAARVKHNPLSWLKDSDVKVEEVYYYAGRRIDKIEREEYDNKGEYIARLTYDANGRIRDGWKQEGAYDEQGNWLMDSWLYYEDGRMTARTDYEYDEHGDKTLGWDYENGVLTRKYRWEYEYDTKGNEISYYAYDDLENQYVPFRAYKYEYDEAGNRTAGWHEEDGLLVYRFATEWDEAGNLVCACQYWYEKGELESWEELEYDGEGNEVKMTSYIWYDGREELGHWEEYEYDARGNRTASYMYLSSGILDEIIETEYDEDDKWVCVFIDHPDKWRESREYKHDAEGRTVSLITRRDNDYDGVYESRTENSYYGENMLTKDSYHYEDGILMDGIVYVRDYMGNSTASYSYKDGSWKRNYLREYRYKCDAAAGILVTDMYEDDFRKTRTITIYR